MRRVPSTAPGHTRAHSGKVPVCPSIAPRGAAGPFPAANLAHSSESGRSKIRVESSARPLVSGSGRTSWRSGERGGSRPDRRLRSGWSARGRASRPAIIAATRRWGSRHRQDHPERRRRERGEGERDRDGVGRGATSGSRPYSTYLSIYYDRSMVSDIRGALEVLRPLSTRSATRREPGRAPRFGTLRRGRPGRASRIGAGIASGARALSSSAPSGDARGVRRRGPPPRSPAVRIIGPARGWPRAGDRAVPWRVSTRAGRPARGGR